MKKILALLLIAVTAVTLVACRPVSDTGTSGGTTRDQATKDSALPKTAEASKTMLEKYIDVDHYTVTDKRSYAEYWLDSKQVSDEQKAGKQRITDDSLVIEESLHIKKDLQVAEIKKQGWDFKEAKKASRTIEAHRFTSAGTQLTNGEKVFKAGFLNSGSTEIAYVDAVVHAVDLELYDFASKKTGWVEKDTAVRFTYNEKIDNDSDLRAIVAALGEPDAISTGYGYSNVQAVTSLTYLEPGIGEVIFELKDDGSQLLKVTLTFEADADTDETE